jgi:hypothetical protein
MKMKLMQEVKADMNNTLLQICYRTAKLNVIQTG